MNNKMLQWLVIVMCTACSSKTLFQNQDVLGLWKMELRTDKDAVSIPFFIEFIEVDGILKAAIWNGEEQIVHDSVQVKDDSLFVESPYFNSTLVIGFNKNVAGGYWEDYSREGYKMPLSGKYNLSQRFRYNGPLEKTIDGKWQVTFSPNTEDAYDAIGVFETDSNSMKGTFITETGDYRFLEGGFAVNQLQLSTFDGAHAFLFEADLSNDTLSGTFYSGKNWQVPFVAWRNENTALTSPYQMTTLVDQSKPISFAFKDLEGNLVTSEDSVYQNTPMLIQIIGSWCPNCMDEASFLVQNQALIKNMGIEIVGLSFERLTYTEAIEPLKKLKKKVGIEYPLLYGGKANKKEATKSIPWIKDIKSYPTLLFVLPNKKVFKIHTGFYGPGTKDYYRKQSSEMLDDIKQLSILSNVTS